MLNWQRWIRLALLLAVGWYVALAFQHYLNQRPLWNDEQAIFINIKQIAYPRLFAKPLLKIQSFPRFYLACIKAFALNFHSHLLALRFFPFIAMMGAFIAWFNVGRLTLKKNEWLLLYVLSWAASIPLVYYAAELKQYSMDVFASGVCLWLLCRGFSRWWYVLPLFCFFSYPSLFWIPLFWWNLMRRGQEDKDWQPLAIYTMVLLAVLSVFYYVDVRVNNKDLSYYWRDYFISFDSIGEFFRTLGEGINNLISRWFAERPKWIRGAARGFMGLGFGYILLSFWRAFKSQGFRFKSIESAALGIFSIHLFFGALHLYPFVVPRTSLFFAPIVLLMRVAAMQRIKERHQMVGTFIQVLFMVYLLITSIGIGRLVFSGDLGAQSVLWQ